MKTNLLGMALAATAAFALVARGDDKAQSEAAPTYLLAYKFAAGEEFRTKVIHLVTIDTQIKGTEQTARTRSVSTKLWRIKKIDSNENIIFEHQVEHVDMWESVSGRKEVRYNSATDKLPPPGYDHVASSIGKPLATVTMDRHGRVLSRENALPIFNPGIGELTIPFPAQAIEVGDTWSIPDEVRVRMDEGIVKKISTRQQYKLEQVETGVATIRVETQVLTPVNDPKVQAQLVQRLQHGTIKFDLDAGRPLRRQMDLDETVQGFSGPESHMEYQARYTEEPVAAERTANSQADDEAQR
ncbi:MAG: hypothetical protein WD872_03360 [Pirellulaceae bacterium]